MLDKGMIFYIGCALIPTPPSPCYDFGLQFVFVIVVALISPKFVIKPINIFLVYLGRLCKKIFGRIPVIKIVVEKTEQGIRLWERLMKKGTKPKNKHLRKLFNLIIKKDFIQRLIAGYFITIGLGILLMSISFIM